MTFQILTYNKGMIRCSFPVCFLYNIFFKYSLDSNYSYPRSSGYTMMVYVRWPSTATEDVPMNFVLDHCFWLCCIDMKFSLQIWLCVQQHRHLLHWLQIRLNTLCLSRPSLHYLLSQTIPPSLELFSWITNTTSHFPLPLSLRFFFPYPEVFFSFLL